MRFKSYTFWIALIISWTNKYIFQFFKPISLRELAAVIINHRQLIDRNMLSAEDTAALRVAFEICTNFELKQKILCLNEREHRMNRKNSTISKYRWTEVVPPEIFEEKATEDSVISKYRWTEIIEKAAAKDIAGLSLTKSLQEKILGMIHSTALRMVNWVVYHESVFGLSRKYLNSSMRSSFFTSYGIINCKKAAEELMKNASLSVEQKYRLSCLYRFSEIPALYYQMREDTTIVDDYGSRNTRQPKLHSIWFTAMAMKNSEKEEYLKSCLLEESIASGCLPAVEFCLDNKIYRSDISMVDYALIAVKNWVKIGNSSPVFTKSGNNVEKSWIPREYYVDILCFLLKKMSKHEKILFLEKDLSSRYENDEDQLRSRVLEMFLDFPYQNNFMPTVNLMWNFLPEENYASLLLQICDRINPNLRGSFKYGEEKTFDYRRLLMQYWVNSPDHNKRNVFKNPKVCYVSHDNDQVEKAKAGEELIHKLLELVNYTSADENIIYMILASSTEAEKQSIISPDDWNICLKLIKCEKWNIIHEVLSSCFDSNEKKQEFKRAFFSANEIEIKNVIIDLIEYETPGAAEFLMNWIGLSVGDVNQLKREMINSDDGKKAFLRLINYDGVQRAASFIEWFNLSREEIAEFKERIIYSQLGLERCVKIFTKLGSTISLIRMGDFIKFCLSSEEAIREFKNFFFEKEGHYVLENLISDCSVDDVYDEEGEIIASKVSFHGGKWEKVENFITWYFPSREEIRDFKKKELLKTSGAQIHFNLIFAGEFEQAEKFFCWLGLSEKEIKELKKETLYSCEEATELLSDMIYNDIFEFTHFGSNREATEIFLKWYLTDEKSVLEFRDLKYKFCKETEDDEDVLKNLEIIAEQLLIDLKNKEKE